MPLVFGMIVVAVLTFVGFYSAIVGFYSIRESLHLRHTREEWDNWENSEEKDTPKGES